MSGYGRFVSIGTGVSHTCGVNTDGDVYCGGLNVYGQLGDGSTVDRFVPTVVVEPVLG